MSVKTVVSSTVLASAMATAIASMASAAPLTPAQEKADFAAHMDLIYFWCTC